MKTRIFIPCIIVFLISCKEKSSDTRPTPKTTEPSTTINSSPTTVNNTPTQPQIKKGDVEILSVRLEKDPQCSWKYQFVTEIRNNGPDDVIFNAYTNWNCPGGAIISASSVLQSGGYLSANTTRVYKNCSSNQLCSPTPGLLDLECKIEVTKTGYQDSNPSNNQKNLRITVPF